MSEILSKKYLEEHLQFLKKMTLDLEICTSNVQDIVNASQENGEKIKIIENFIGHYAYLTYSYSSMCVYKLFYINEKRSFLKLFNKLENLEYDIELQELLQNNALKDDNQSLFSSKEQVIETIKELRTLINNKKETITKIKNRRDTFYAHNDPNKKFPPETLKDLIEMKKLAETVFQTLYGGFLDSHFMLKNTYWTINPIIDNSLFMYNYYKDTENLFT